MRFGLIVSILVGAVVMLVPPPEGMGDPAWRALGFAVAMAALWLTEALPLAVTALVPLALFPLAGLGGIEDQAKAYAHPLIILFLGGFLVARAIERWELHLALATRLLSRVGREPSAVIAGLMLVTAFLSFWISNTASTMVMAPIAAAMAASRPSDERFAVAALLGVAYAATIGGMGSLIGTPPNAILAAHLSERYDRVIGFAEWALIGLPVVAVMLPLVWLLLTKVQYRPNAGLFGLPSSNAPLSIGAKRVAWIGSLAALGLLLRPLIERQFPEAGVTDAGIAILAGVLLFAVPSGSGGRLLDWETAKGLRWDVLILFGGGLALAGTIERSGLATWLAGGIARVEGLGQLWVILTFAVVIVLIGELASNTAMAAIFLPVAGATATGFGMDAASAMVPIALAASVGFMLPVATPPNAIVFAYPAITRARMLRAGAGLDLVGIVVAVFIPYALAQFML
ncbi:DASS family sodium-coupled anion symporter [Mameliella sp. CS4]|uniref:SLC13 family permease n=1 Tax=Mameliella sp. CS4 TaxID=2862329 RepID=UPI001C5E690E|nr:DASS family sodium-coupled anion symporter [Mameliella sp. CS4]MBW4986016.1 DASS family sodium-coupled anion symporter [Mameliella sp. CS4]